MALANCYAAMEMGVAIIESAAGGLGGCPNAPSATGNLAAEELIYMLNGLGIETGVDLDKVVAIGQWATKTLDHRLCSLLGQLPLPAELMEYGSKEKGMTQAKGVRQLVG